MIHINTHTESQYWKWNNKNLKSPQPANFLWQWDKENTQWTSNKKALSNKRDLRERPASHFHLLKKPFVIRRVISVKIIYNIIFNSTLIANLISWTLKPELIEIFILFIFYIAFKFRGSRQKSIIKNKLIAVIYSDKLKK